MLRPDRNATFSVKGNNPPTTRDARYSLLERVLGALPWLEP
jgi:hypothetical protein